MKSKLRLKVNPPYCPKIIISVQKNWQVKQLMSYITLKLNEVTQIYSNDIKVKNIKRNDYFVVPSQKVGQIFNDQDEVKCELEMKKTKGIQDRETRKNKLKASRIEQANDLNKKNKKQIKNDKIIQKNKETEKTHELQKKTQKIESNMLLKVPSTKTKNSTSKIKQETHAHSPPKTKKKIKKTYQQIKDMESNGIIIIDEELSISDNWNPKQIPKLQQ